APWVDLGIVHLRLGDFDSAAPFIERAVSLVPENSSVRLVQGQLEVARGQLDAGIAQFRRAIELTPGSLKARYALAQALESRNDPASDAEAQLVYEQLLALPQGNVAAELARARLAAKRADTAALRDAVTRLMPRVTRWPEVATAQFQAFQSAVA